MDGELHELEEPVCSPEDTKDYAASLMSEKQIRRFSETNEIDFAYSAPNSGRYRVNVYRQRGTISIAMRHVVTRVPNFSELNLPPVVQQMALEPRGMVLVTGTTGSGKTTTLASMIDHINRNLRRHIVTVEDPIEILHSDMKCIVNQREIGLDTENYATALKYVLQAGPGHHPHRRDARPGDGADGSDRRPDRPLRAQHPAHHRRVRDGEPYHRLLPALPAEAGAHHAGRLAARASSPSGFSCGRTARAGCRRWRSWS